MPSRARQTAMDEARQIADNVAIISAEPRIRRFPTFEPCSRRHRRPSRRKTPPAEFVKRQRNPDST